MADLLAMLSAASGGGPSGPGEYIEDLFSTYLYTGNSSSQTITNNIDLANEGGMVWIKDRTSTNSHSVFDTVRNNGYLVTNGNFAINSSGGGIPPGSGIGSFNSDGFTLADGLAFWNTSSTDYVSWTFRKAPKFFDVVTYTGTGVARTVSHNLGSVPGCIIVKRTDTTGDWQVYHRANTANPETDYLVLNSTAATVDSNTRWNDTAPTSTAFTVGTEATVNASGGTYVAYLFANDAGGFGDDGTENAISCGSWTQGASNVEINLGYEPQFIMMKASGSTSGWYMWDTIRGLVVDPNSGTGDRYVFADTSGAEGGTWGINPTATGFIASAGWTQTDWIYIAIRRGPMKVPTSATEVYNAITYTGNSTQRTLTTSVYSPDFTFIKSRNVAPVDGRWQVFDRLRGATSDNDIRLIFDSTAAEAGPFNSLVLNLTNNTVELGNAGACNASGENFVGYFFKRAPGFFDVVCYTGTSVATAVDHNLGVAPEMIILKSRTITTNWVVFFNGVTITNDQYFILNSTSQVLTTAGREYWGSPSTGTPSMTASSFSVGTRGEVNDTTGTYVAYLFATLAGVSKVGTYTGTGTTLQIDCGFSAGARFVMIKRSDGSGAWYVWDSARGIASGNDPYVVLNTSAGEVTSTDYIDPLSSGFEISSTAPAEINASGGTFIFLAIA